MAEKKAPAKKKIMEEEQPPVVVPKPAPVATKTESYARGLATLGGNDD